MSEEGKNQNPKPDQGGKAQSEKSTNFEKGVRIDLNESKLPEFQLTPPPPPAPQSSSDSSGSDDNG